jgi:hypothetical protein
LGKKMGGEKREKGIFLEYSNLKVCFKGTDLCCAYRNRKNRIWWPVFEFYGSEVYSHY